MISGCTGSCSTFRSSRSPSWSFCSRLDAQIFALGNLVSGHTLKHLASALGTYWILRMLKTRHPLAVPDLSTVP